MVRKSLIRLLLVDDYAVLREALTLVFNNESDIVVVGEAASGQEALDQCARLQPDVVLMDLHMPGMDGVTATRLIRDKYPRTKVIALTSLTNPDQLERALEAGAKKILFKDAAIDHMCDTVREVAGSLTATASAGR